VGFSSKAKKIFETSNKKTVMLDDKTLRKLACILVKKIKANTAIHLTNKNWQQKIS